MTPRISKQVTSPPSRAEITRERIMRAGEQLFARNGIESTSMRMVAAAAGQSNVAAVQYHFGSKEGLIAAIFEDRVEQMEEPRKAMLAGIGEVGDATLRQLLELVYVPYLDLVDEQGNHVYARVLLDYLSRYGRFMIPHPASDMDRSDLVINQVLTELERRMDDVGMTGERVPYSMLVMGILGVLNDHDLRRERGLKVRPVSDLLDEMIDFMARTLAVGAHDAGGSV
ncbi:hypothetical protein GCM10011371_28990 [Novosphingobium marinum]|uniref:AcrR family transcriptional regulator n=1 Tax=Novosphingobium marinum TaxID=1514948 RepID=A0A7Y9Y164_9SPHN|nr:TetR/AcrR family transcriptional regulator [Novosphingobium marinum]NYH96838.1 AcrR family transcriptional regulator [Novosphingobium marinum]GGC39847.1 hypothetical protein GCM10011371_28990 [Novosphingobium marinum]